MKKFIAAPLEPRSGKLGYREDPAFQSHCDKRPAPFLFGTCPRRSSCTGPASRGSDRSLTATVPGADRSSGHLGAKKSPTSGCLPPRNTPRSSWRTAIRQIWKKLTRNPPFTAISSPTCPDTFPAVAHNEHSQALPDCCSSGYRSLHPTLIAMVERNSYEFRLADR